VSASSPFLASAKARTLSALIDLGPTLLFVIFGAALADRLQFGAAGTLTAAITIYLAYHAAFNTAWDGETPGRRMMHIRLVNSHGDGLSPARAVLRPIVRVAWIAAFFPLVRQANSFAIFCAPISIDALLMFSLQWRQTTADFVCGTLVVNAPAVQPHRAPAGPMYSATDAEFGVRPRRLK